MAEIKRKTKKKSQGAFLRDSIMTGISYMIPVIVGAGVIQALADMISETTWIRLIQLQKQSCFSDRI